MTPTREDIALYVSGNYEGDIAVLEAAIAADAGLATVLAEEAELELLLRDAAAAATFCPACDEIVRDARCNGCGAAMRPGGYTVERVLVSNAHGRMYVAHDADGKRVALKELAFVHAPSPAAIAAFEREAKFLRALSHPAIPRFLASFEEGQGVHTRYYLAQELVEGTALDKLEDKWYTEAEIVDIAKQVLVILEYLQSLSPMVIHRDIKPANLIVRADKTIALVDFGAAHAHGTTAGVTTIGTFGYMPIEQLAGIVDATTDLYALGASLLHLLTRQEPWKLAQSKTTVNVSAPLRAFLDKLTAQDPKDRFASAKDAMAALEDRERLATAVPRPAHSGRKRRIVIAAITATALAAAGAGVYEYSRATGSSNEPQPRAAEKFSTIRASLGPGVTAKLFVDGTLVGTMSDGQTVTLSAGEREVKLITDNGSTCHDTIKLEAGKTTTLECNMMPAPAAPPRLNVRTRFSKSFKGGSLHNVMQELSDACDLNIVVPDYISAKISGEFADVPCDETLEVILESNGLWYEYRPESKLLRVAPRKDLDAGAEAAIIRARNEGRLPQGAIVDDPLPAGPKIDLDLKDAHLQDVVALISATVKASFVVPDHVGGKVTIRVKNVPWEQALETVLASHGLWYRYRAEAKIVRIAPRKELDAEVEAALKRQHLP